MNKLFLVILTVLLAISAQAQSSISRILEDTHLKFEGVPICGPLNEFVDKIVSMGFEYGKSSDEGAVLTGDFAGYTDCYIAIATVDKEEVGSVTVLFPEGKNWSSLEKQYRRLKDMLTAEYGAPEKEIEVFQNGDPKDDYLRLQELRKNRCQYQTIYSSIEGMIVLILANDDIIGCHATISYFDISYTLKRLQSR